MQIVVEQVITPGKPLADVSFSFHIYEKADDAGSAVESWTSVMEVHEVRHTEGVPCHSTLQRRAMLDLNQRKKKLKKPGVPDKQEEATGGVNEEVCELAVLEIYAIAHCRQPI